MEMYRSNDEGSRTFAWRDISPTSVTSSLTKQMKTLSLSGEGQIEQEEGQNIGSQGEEFASSDSVKNKVYKIEVLLLTKALEMVKGMEKRCLEKYEELQLRLKLKTPGENGRSKQTKEAKPSIRNETLRPNERRKIHQLETERQRSRARKKMTAKAFKQLGETPAKWKPSVSRALDRNVENLTSEARLHDLNRTADEMAVLLHQKKQLREKYFTVERNEKAAKQRALKEARKDRKELLLLPRLHRKRASKKIKSAKMASEKRVRKLLGRDLFNTQWQEIQQTAYSINFTRPHTFSYFHGLKKNFKARRVASA